MPGISVIIPALNEEKAIANVLADIPAELVQEVIVIDNGSDDNTAVAAENAGATVIAELKKGYGYSCLKGMEYLTSKEVKPDIVVFLDGDYSDYPEEMNKLVSPIANSNIDMVIGSRTLGSREKGAMLPQQLFGNWLATSLLKVLYGARFTDLGPFRAIKYDKLMELKMTDTTYGWTVEMQIKAAKAGLKFAEVPVNYRKRIGKSKITGTVKGTVLAGYKIISTIIKYL